MVGQRFLAIRCGWCSRHSLQIQPATYAAVVPCLRSVRRVAVRAASSAADHTSSVLANPHNLIGRQARVTERSPERLAGVDGIQDLLPNLDGKPLLCLSSLACPSVVALQLSALDTTAALIPPRHRAVRRLGSTTVAIRIDVVADLI